MLMYDVKSSLIIINKCIESVDVLDFPVCALTVYLYKKVL